MNLLLPWPLPALSPNFRSRSHWPKTRAAKAYRAQCGWIAKECGIRRMEATHLDVIITFLPPDKRARDRDNMVASFKSGQDGIVDIIGVDDSKWRTVYLVGDPVKGGAVHVQFPVTTRGAGE